MNVDPLFATPCQAAYMSQPKMQLTTFASWLGSGASDISYYLNAHHIDLLEWCLEGKARPVLVFGSGSTGVAKALTGADVEDTITL
jgi:D-galacturonate reductase